MSEEVPTMPKPMSTIMVGDARKLDIADSSVDLIVTSPPYWQKRDYEIDAQIGLEPTPREYVDAIMDCLNDWKRVLRPHGSVFLNVGDTYFKRSLAGIPGRIESAAVDAGWLLRNRIVWAKTGGMPEPARDRLANRHEYILHLTPRKLYYYDLFGYAEKFGSGANPGDVWAIDLERNTGKHLAPYPREIVQRAITLACPEIVCTVCGTARSRIVEKTGELDPMRPQAKRAMELASQHNLTAEHFAAIRATGISDSGKALKVQTGTGRNSDRVKQLAAEAKAALGGYFREYTFGLRATVGWTSCGHNDMTRGVVLDPFAGTGTTVAVAAEMGRDAYGVDLNPLLAA